jgi:hypothetical protein
MDEDGADDGDDDDDDGDDAEAPTKPAEKRKIDESTPAAAFAPTEVPPTKRALVGGEPASGAASRMSAAASEFRPTFAALTSATAAAAKADTAAAVASSPFRFDASAVRSQVAQPQQRRRRPRRAASPLRRRQPTRSTTFLTPTTLRSTASAPVTPASPLTETSASALVASAAAQTAELSDSARAVLSSDARRLLEFVRAIAADDREAATTVITQWQADNAPLCEYVQRKSGSLRDTYDRLVRIVAPPTLRSLVAVAGRVGPSRIRAVGGAICEPVVSEGSK